MSSSGEFFDHFADHFDTLYDGKRSRFMQAVDKRFRSDMFVRFAMTFELLGDLSGKRVLDIGCGSGPYLLEALKRGAEHVTGIDPAPRMLELAAERLESAGLREKSDMIRGYFPQVPIAGEHDYAIVMGVMDYVPDPKAFLAALRESVTSGAVLSFPSTHWFRTPFRKVRYTLRHCPVWFYTQAKIERMFQEIGASDVKVHKIPGAGMDFVVWMRI